MTCKKKIEEQQTNNIARIFVHQPVKMVNDLVPKVVKKDLKINKSSLNIAITNENSISTVKDREQN